MKKKLTKKILITLIKYIENPAYVSYFITTSQIEKSTYEITGPMKSQDSYSCDVVIKYDT
jgi:hypothetical protein